MGNKKNYWKSASIALMIVLVCLMIFNFAIPKDYNFKELGFKMKQSDFNSLAGQLQPNQRATLCNSQTNKCVLVGRLR
jgi:hypothetical protein